MFILRLPLYGIKLNNVSVVFIWTDHCIDKLCLSLFQYCRLVKLVYDGSGRRVPGVGAGWGASIN